MKKLSVLLMSICSATALVACGSGSSSGSSSGGNGGGSTADTPQPTKYSESIPTGGTLISLNNLYLTTDTTDAPLSFGVESITADTTVSFTVQANNSTSSGKLQATTTLPTITPSSCTFTTGNPQTCTLQMNTSGAPAGSYNVVPIVGESSMPPISVTTQSASSVTLPNGYYINYSSSVDETCRITPPKAGSDISVLGNQLCLPKYDICMPNSSIPIPSGTSSFGPDVFFTNVAWTGSVLTLNSSIPNCPGVFITSKLVKTTLTLSSNTNECTLDFSKNPTIDTNIEYTISGTIPGHDYAIRAINNNPQWNVNDVPVTKPVTAISDTLTITATCEHLDQRHRDADSKDVFAIDYSAGPIDYSESWSPVRSNELPFTVNVIYPPRL